MSERAITVTAGPIDVVVGPDPTKQVVLVEVIATQGVPGPPGPPGPTGPPGDLPDPAAGDLRKTAIVRDLAGVPTWKVDYVTPADIQGAIPGAQIADDSLVGQKWAPGAWFSARMAGFGLHATAVLNAASARWTLYNAGAEAAGNVGNDLVIERFDNAGAYLGTPFTLDRASGRASFWNDFNVAGLAYVGQLGTRTILRFLGAADMPRFALEMNGAEAAGNAGMDLGCQRYDNAGAYLGTPFWIQRANGQVHFPELMPNGPDGNPFGYARLKPKYYTANAWLEAVQNGGVQIAQAGCAQFVATKPGTQALVDGYRVRVANQTGGAIVIQQEAGISLLWVNPAGAALNGNRTLAHGAFVEVAWLGGVWMISGTGIT